MPLSKSQFKHRPQWQREALREQYENSQRYEQPKRTSVIQSARRNTFGITLRHFEPQVQPGHCEPVSIVPSVITGDGIPTRAYPHESGLHVMPLQEPELPAIRCDIESGGIPDESE